MAEPRAAARISEVFSQRAIPDPRELQSPQGSLKTDVDASVDTSVCADGVGHQHLLYSPRGFALLGSRRRRLLHAASNGHHRRRHRNVSSSLRVQVSATAPSSWGWPSTSRPPGERTSSEDSESFSVPSPKRHGHSVLEVPQMDVIQVSPKVVVKPQNDGQVYFDMFQKSWQTQDKRKKETL